MTAGRRTAPAALGLSPEPLERLAAAIRAGDYPNVHGVLIAKDGRLVYEDYFDGWDIRYGQEEFRDSVSIRFDRDSLHDVRSITKSVTSAVVGMAVADGAITTLDTPLVAFFPDYASRAAAGFDQVTLRHALTMTGGLDWNEADVPLTDPTNDDERMEASRDPAGLVFSRGLVTTPGSSWYYNGGLPLLLGMIVSRTAGLPFGAYARENLFEPLGFGPLEWAGPTTWNGVPELVWEGSEAWSGSANPGGEMWIRPRDLLKFGALYLGGGAWNGRQLLSADWVASSLTPSVWRTEGFLGHGRGVSSRGGYGYFWWYDEFSFPDGDLVVYSAGGNGGQRVWVIPALDVVAVHLTGNYNLPWSHYQAERLLLERIVPWAQGRDAGYHHEIGRPVRVLDGGELDLIVLTGGERELYAGTYQEPGERIEVREESGLLRMGLPGAGVVDLIPLGEHTFALGRLDEAGMPTELHWPDERVVFVLDEQGTVLRYEYRDVGDGTVWGEGLRLPAG